MAASELPPIPAQLPKTQADWDRFIKVMQIWADQLQQTEAGERAAPRPAAETTSGSTRASAPWPQGNVARYGALGDGTTDDSAAILAAAAACAANGWALYFAPGTYRISTSLTLPVPLVFEGGAILAPDANVAIHIRSSVIAGPWQIFNLSKAGSSVAGICGPEIRAEWFGALDPTGTLDNTAAFTAWLKAGKTLPSGLNRIGIYTCNPGHYKITAGLTLDASHQLCCPGVVLDFASAPSGIVAITLQNADGQQINADALGGLSLHGPGAGTTLGRLGAAWDRQGGCGLQHAEADPHPRIRDRNKIRRVYVAQ